MKESYISESMGLKKQQFSPKHWVSFSHNQGVMGGLVFLGKGTAMASAPSLEQVLHSHHLRGGNIHAPDFYPFLLCTECSTKGNLFSPPWDPAGPGHGQRGALTCHTRKEFSPCCSPVLTGTSHLLCPPVQPTPCAPSVCRGNVSLPVLHPRGQATSPSGSPCACPGCCSWWAPSIPLSLGCLAAPFGQRVSRRDLHIV